MNYLEEDLNIISQSEYAEKFKGRKVLVTGATGLVGSLLVRTLLRTDAEIYVVVRNADKAADIYGSNLEKLHVITGDIVNDDWCNGISEDINYVFHCAAVTSSKIMVSNPVETIRTAVYGTDNLLKFAVEHHVDRFIYVSSMELYGSLPEKVTATEDKLGYLDIGSVRSDYPESKRMCENLCTAYGKEYGLDVRSARLAQTFGPGILPWENRVFSQFARSVIDGTDIVLHTRGLSEGNYCYTRDMILGLFTILFRGISGESYNVVNESTHITIAGMAQMVADQVAEGRISVVYDIPDQNKFGYAADTHLKLSGKKLENLGWKPQVGLREMYERMIGDIRYRRHI